MTTLSLFATGCAAIGTGIKDGEASAARGPWAEVSAVEMPTGDTSVPIELLRDVADALLKRPGAKVCDPATRRPIIGLSTEYCSTIYVAGNRDSLSWRVTEPKQGDHESCRPYFAVQDSDYPAPLVWVVGYVHNHPCGATPSSADLRAWPTDAFQPHVAMTEVRLIPGNPAPAVYKNTGIEMASALVAEYQDGTRVFLRYFTTGEIQQWSMAKSGWVKIGRCTPRRDNRIPQCDEPLRLIHE